MNIVSTKSFKLAVYAKGNSHASKFAIVVPGRLDTKDYIHMTSLVDFLAMKGYYAISFDPPGSWESEGTIDLVTTTNYITAINELIEYYQSKSTLLAGHSRGGTVAMLAANNPLVWGLVSIMATYGEPSPASKAEQEQGYHLSYRDVPPGSEKTHEQKRFELPLNYFADGARYHPVDSLMKLQKPKLLIYGTDDSFTKPERVKEVFAGLPYPKMLQEVKCEHDYRLHADIIEQVNATIGKFTDTYETV